MAGSLPWLIFLPPRTQVSAPRPSAVEITTGWAARSIGHSVSPNKTRLVARWMNRLRASAGCFCIGESLSYLDSVNRPAAQPTA